jgi:large repetitive protein
MTRPDGHLSRRSVPSRDLLPERGPCRARHGVAGVGAVLLLTLGLLTVGAGRALAEPVSCGAVLTTDTTLSSDLLECPGDGLVIGAPGITVDLGGHTLSGRIISGGSPDQVGIDNSAGHDDVIVKNGVVRDFKRGGIHLVRADRTQVLGLTMDFFGEFGILLEGGSSNRFINTLLDRPGTVGIGVYGTAMGPSRGNVIAGNRVDGANTANIALRYKTIGDTVIDGNQVSGAQNEPTGTEYWGAGVVVSFGEADITGTRVTGNTIHNNFGGGLFVGGSANATVVEGNTLYDNPEAAIENNGDQTVIRSNTIDSTFTGGFSDFGIQVDAGAEATRVEANTITRTWATAVDDSGYATVVTANVIDGQSTLEFFTGIWAGIVVREEARRGRIEGNQVLNNEGGGIEVSGDNFVVADNTVTQTGLYEDGIRVEPQAGGTLVEGNLSTRHGDDGIDVDSRATTVTANVANDNADLGIEAVPGVKDGGGNQASGNGNPAQCVGVVCA